MATVGISRLLSTSSSSSSSSPLPRPSFLLSLHAAMIPIFVVSAGEGGREGGKEGGREEEGLLGSPHLALTLAAIVRLERGREAGREGGVFRGEEKFLTLLAARAGERAGRMEEWERVMVRKGIATLGGRVSEALMEGGREGGRKRW